MSSHAQQSSSLPPQPSQRPKQTQQNEPEIIRSSSKQTAVRVNDTQKSTQAQQLSQLPKQAPRQQSQQPPQQLPQQPSHLPPQPQSQLSSQQQPQLPSPPPQQQQQLQPKPSSQQNEPEITNSGSKRKVVRLDGTQKSAILAEIDRRQKSGVEYNLGQISEWAQAKWSLDSKPHYATISRIIRNKMNILELVDEGEGTRKKRRTLKSEALEAVLVIWMWEQFSKHIFLSDDHVKQKGMQILTLANELMPEEKRLDMKFSNGWLEKFKKRNKVKRYRSKDDAQSNATQLTQSTTVADIVERVSKFERKDVWNAVEFGLYFMLGPYDSANNRSKPAASTQAKYTPRLTCLVCSNGDGSEKFPVTMIGKAPFSRRRTEHDIKFDYYQNVRSWMNTLIFFEWLKKFDRFIGKTKDRKAILLLDPISCHGSLEMIPELPNVEVVYLPSDMQRSVLPMHAGPVPCIKRRYRRRQMSRALDVLDEDGSKMYRVDQCTAMKWICDIWASLESNIICEGWYNSGLLKHPDGEERRTLLSQIAGFEQTDIDVILRQVHPNRTRKHITIAEFLNPPGEDDCIAHLTDQYLVEDLVNALVNCSEGVEQGEIWEDVISKMSCKEQLQYLGFAMRILERNVSLPDKFRRIVDSTKLHLRAEYRNVECRIDQKKPIVSAKHRRSEMAAQQQKMVKSSLLNTNPVEQMNVNLSVSGPVHVPVRPQSNVTMNITAPVTVTAATPATPSVTAPGSTPVTTPAPTRLQSNVTVQQQQQSAVNILPQTRSIEQVKVVGPLGPQSNRSATEQGPTIENSTSAKKQKMDTSDGEIDVATNAKEVTKTAVKQSRATEGGAEKEAGSAKEIGKIATGNVEVKPNGVAQSETGKSNVKVAGGTATDGKMMKNLVQ